MSNQNFSYREVLYYLIKTDDKFVRQVTNDIFKDKSLRILEVVGRDSHERLIVRGFNNPNRFSVNVDAFTESVEIINSFSIILN